MVPMLMMMCCKLEWCSVSDNDNDDDDDLYIIGAVCLWVTKVIILPFLPKVLINRRNCVSTISRHFSKVPINRRNCVSPISRHSKSAYK